MITDKDIAKMKKVFATKDDLTAMEKRQDAKYATKDDLTKLKTDMFIDMSKNRDQIIRGIGDLLHDTFIPVIDQLEMRIKRIEKHLGLASRID